MKVSDIMTNNVAYVDPKATITEAAKLMKEHNVGSIPVCDQNGVVGIITDRDIVVRNVVQGTDPNKTTVEDVMTTKVTTVTPDEDVREVTKIMAQQQVRRVPVVENNKLVGMVALGDIAVNAVGDVELAKTLADISLPAKPRNIDKK